MRLNQLLFTSAKEPAPDLKIQRPEKEWNERLNKWNLMNGLFLFSLLWKLYYHNLLFHCNTVNIAAQLDNNCPWLKPHIFIGYLPSRTGKSHNSYSKSSWLFEHLSLIFVWVVKVFDDKSLKRQMFNPFLSFSIIKAQRLTNDGYIWSQLSLYPRVVIGTWKNRIQNNSWLLQGFSQN